MVSLELLDNRRLGRSSGWSRCSLSACLGLVSLADGDDLPVAGLEPEHGPACLVDMDLVLRNLLGLVAFDSLDLDPGVSVFLNGLDPVLDASRAS